MLCQNIDQETKKTNIIDPILDLLQIMYKSLYITLLAQIVYVAKITSSKMLDQESESDSSFVGHSRHSSNLSRAS
ncbi:hypothetical protein BpHYR1_022591 [Brachionus plicatilis]|uniref:Uncharacterized protein n=1 Tax=Brachionus plicatilis TaxID=10195 RepID=A0A3M7T7M3_BRAPC|nr:hypothetical protein BpHYR1_022591 [Brachionus plicatilis]